MDKEEFERLSQEFVAGNLNAGDRERLADYLAKDEQRLCQFVDQVQLHQMLRVLLASDSDTTDFSETVPHELRCQREAGAFSNAVVDKLKNQSAARFRWRAGFAAAACVLIVLFATLFIQNGTPGDEIGTIVESGNGVELVRSGRKQPATAGMNILTGDRIITSANTAAAFALTDKTQVRLDAQTNLLLEQSNAGQRLSVDQGKITLSVTKRDKTKSLIVVTPQAAAEVVGTQFTVVVAEGSTKLEVDEGKVRFTRTDGRELIVPAGHEAVSAPNVRFEVVAKTDTLRRISRDKAVLFVVGQLPISGSDGLISSRLQKRGHKVISISLSALSREEIDAHRFIIVSSTVLVEKSPVPSSVLKDLKHTEAPILTWEPRLFRPLGMIEDDVDDVHWGAEKNLSELMVVNPAHPAANGLSGLISVTKNQSQFSWGRISDQATVIARFKDDSDKAALFVYPRSSPMADGTRAAGPRAAAFLFDFTAQDLTDSGWRLFDGAVDWCLSPAAQSN